MPKNSSFTQREKDLFRRYLIWCYKTTKEDLDRVDRYFTQNRIDGFLLNTLRRSKDYQSAKLSSSYKALVDDFEKYMQNKQANALAKKFLNEKQKKFHPHYEYLRNRFAAIEKAIVHFLGLKELKVIGGLYEEEMTRRIWEAREHT